MEPWKARENIGDEENKDTMTGTEPMIKRKYIRIAEAVFLVGIMILFACLFDYQYAMNDDVLIHEILSGRYSGMPSAHNISCLILLNGIFALLYRICSFVPWFGIFVVSVQFCSLYGIVMCLERKMKFRATWRYFFLVIVNLLLMGLMLRELVVVQYTYTAALLTTSATVQLSCMEDEESVSHRRFWRYFVILMQYLLAFCLRAEICLFLLPFSIVLTIIDYHKRNGLHIIATELKKWGLFWGALLLCLAGAYVADCAGYASDEWRDYREVDQYRTQLYDFLALPEYTENQDFYEKAGISKVQYELLKNYNFSLDERITADTLQKVVEYANEKRIEKYQGLEKLYMQFFTLPLREGIWAYGHKVLLAPEASKGDYPWNLVCVVLYLLLILLTCLTKKAWNILYLFLLFFVRSVLWMYIILKQRMPTRVTHSLLIMEIACLLVLLFEELCLLDTKEILPKIRRLFTGMALLSLCGAGAVMINSGISFSKTYRDTVNDSEGWQELLDYCAQRKDCFYFMDVYSTVNYWERIFGRANDEVENYDICGGWLAKSPLCEEKYEKFGFHTPQEALLEKKYVFFIAKQDKDLSWLPQLYEESGIQIELEYLEKVADQFDIIRLQVISEDVAGESPFQISKDMLN